MAWIPMRTDLRQSPKVVAMARYLVAEEHFCLWCGTKRDEIPLQVASLVVTGALLEVWSALQSDIKSDDTVASICIDDIDEMAGGVPYLGEAMVHVGWAEKAPNGIKFPNFREYNIPEKERRPALSGAERMSRHRIKKRDESVTKSDEKTSPQNSTVHNKKKNPPNPPKGGKVSAKYRPEEEKLPQQLDTPRFRNGWGLWCAHRSEIKKPLKPTQVKEQLKGLSEAGEAKAYDTVLHTVAMGWQGLRAPESGKPDPQGDRNQGLEALNRKNLEIERNHNQQVKQDGGVASEEDIHKLLRGVRK